MAKYKVLQKFRNNETMEIYEAGQEVELTVKRADEAIENLKKHNGDFLERIEEKEVVEEKKEAKPKDKKVKEGK